MKLKFLFLVSSLFLFSCDPARDQKNNPIAKIEIAPESLSCEKQLRNKMLNKELRLQEIPEIKDEVKDANAEITNLNDVKYGIYKIKSLVRALRLGFQSMSEFQNTEISYEMRLPELTKENKFLLNIQFDRIKINKSALMIRQGYVVDTSCNLKLTSTHVERVRQSSVINYNYSETNYYIDGKSDEFDDLFVVPKGVVLSNLNNYTDTNIERLPPKAIFYSKSTRALRMNVIDAQIEKLNEFSKEINLKWKKIDFLSNEKVLFSAYFGGDKILKISVTEGVMGERSWSVPFDIWNRTFLSESENLNLFVSVKLPKDYLISHTKIKLTTSVVPSYDHFSAYWNIDSKKINDDNKFSLVLSQSAKPLIKDKSSKKDLESNPTIQTDLKEIQDIARKIKPESASNRSAQLQGILNYLKNNYKYDYEMLKYNVIRPLSAKEALQAGKGVCQHYSVLFTTIARALEIPTRIVMGYSISSGDAIAHAWVESEIEPGVWQVIEPQLVDSLTGMQTRAYIPLMRALNLENKDNSSLLEISQFINLDYTIEPAD